MKNRIISIFAVIALMTAFCIPSFATNYYASDESGKQTIPEYIENIQVATEGVEIPKEAKNNTYELTPDGNLTLIDDYYEQTESDKISQKQFLTVTTKAGNTFYIVVDRDGNADNVYLLNLVDEADLMALINDEEVTVTTTETTTEEETSAEDENEEKPEKKSNGGTILLVLLVIGGGGFAVYWFKFRNAQPKEKNDNNTDTDEDDYADDFQSTETDYFESEDKEE